MKILFYLPDLRAGGAERVLLSLVDYLSTVDEVQVLFLVNTTNGDLLEQYESKIQIHNLNRDGYLKPIFPLINFLKLHKPKYVISTLNATIVMAFAAPFLPKSIKRISRLGNTIGAEKYQFNPLKAVLYKRLHYYIYKKADLVICQSNYMRDDYLKELHIEPSNKVIRIYNPVQLDNREPSEHLKDFEFITVARLFPQKNLTTMIKAMEILCKKNPSLKLCILGEGPDRTKLENEIIDLNLQENVILKGYIADTKKELHQSKIFVLSSIFEGFSNALIEALACGLPAVVSNCPGGNAEVIKEGFNGYLFKMAEAEEMAEKMEKALSNYNVFDQLAIREDVQHRFGIKKIVAEYLNALNKLK